MTIRIRDPELIRWLSVHPSPSFVAEGLLRVARAICNEQPLLCIALGMRPDGNERVQEITVAEERDGINELLL